MLGIALGQEIHNQGISRNNRPPVIWENLRFRSATEKKIAEAWIEPVCSFFLTVSHGLPRLKAEKTRNQILLFVIKADGAFLK